jgi:probable rRNA maturation factor
MPSAASKPAKPKLTLAVQYAVGTKTLPSRADLRRWAAAALQQDVQATLRIVGEAEGRQLNGDYRGKDYATNVLTFVYGADPETGAVTGDIVLCAPVVTREAKEQKKPLAAHYAHLIVHGFLHLQGYDHETEAEAAVMEALESFIIQSLGYPDPYQ